MNADFVHLHLHTQYSLLDGTIRIDSSEKGRDTLISRSLELGYDAVAVTDHGNLFGAVHFYKAAKNAGIKPIIGCEAYVARHGAYTERIKGSKHLILLAKNNIGYANLVKLISEAHLHGKYYHHRIDKALLARHSEGLIALSACLGGVVNKEILDNNLDQARQEVLDYKEIFEPGHFYLEVQKNGLEKQEQANAILAQMSADCDVPLIATCDAHYLHREEAWAQYVLMCVSMGKTVDSEDALHHDTDQMYFRSPEEVKQAFAEFPEAVANTVRVAEMCDVELDLGNNYLPQFPVPGGDTYETYLAKVAREGLEERFAQVPYEVDQDQYRQRLEQELDIINSMGFPGYFLIVWDFIRYARNEQIPVGPGRGSGAGSIVAWAMQITDIDPIPYNLLFERFLNPERVSMPDFDIDFCPTRRDDVVRYVRQKYNKEGEDHVAQIVTFSSLKPRSAVREVARALNFSYGEADEIAKLIPETLGMTMSQAREIEPELNKRAKADARIAKLLDTAQFVEGLHRHTGVHAAGVVISQKPLMEHAPLTRGKDDEIVTQFTMNDCEAVGLVKFDFLGLKTLTLIEDTVRLANKNLPPERQIDLNRLPLDDPKVFRLIGEGHTDGVFQLESPGFKNLLLRMRPDRFEDIIAAVALYRPGPLESGMVDDFIKRKHGLEKVSYPHPWLKDVLEETYGTIVYQEQVMRISQVLAGYSLGKADLLRRAMGKKKKDVMEKQKAEFMSGAAEKGVDKDTAAKIFDHVEKFAGYGFNKSHSAAYALISYRTAYLKAHFPTEFMAALMTSDHSNADKVVKYISVAREMGIDVLPPDINESEWDFSIAEGGGIRFGFGAVKNAGENAIREIMKVREEEGGYKSLAHFCRLVDLSKVNRRVVESLIRCGAFDSLHDNRAAMMQALDEILAVATAAQRDRAAGQVSLFEDADDAAGDMAMDVALPNVPDWDEREKLAGEKELLGFYVSSHPLEKVREQIDKCCDAEIDLLADLTDRKRIHLAGMVAGLDIRVTQKGKGDKMATMVLEDLTGRVEVMVFPRTYAECGEILKKDEPIRVVGFARREEEEGNLRVIANKIELLEEANALKGGESLAEVRERIEAARIPKQVILQLEGERFDPESLAGLRSFLTAHEGPTRIVLMIRFPGRMMRINLSEKVGTDTTAWQTEALEATYPGLKVVLGESEQAASVDAAAKLVKS